MITVMVPQEEDDELAAFEEDLNAPPATVERRAISATPAQLGRRVLLWAGVTLVAMALVVYGLGPYFQQRDQRRLFDSYRTRIEQAANEATGLAGIEIPTKAPDPGAPVGVLEIGALQVQQVAVEGVSPSQTATGPGHVPGTAGLGQPGNSVVVARHAAFGGPFAGVADLRPGDSILVTTTQGQSIYEVASVRTQSVVPSPSDLPDEDVGSSGPPATEVASVDGALPDPLGGDVVTVDALFGRTADSRLTLVTSAAVAPWNGSLATVVTATLESPPFAPTPQGGRTDSQTGLTGDATAWAPIGLALVAYGLAIGAAIVLYRRSTPRTAYLLTAPPLITCTIVAAEAAARLLPSWA